jgi:hypothetical protein
MQYLFLLFGDEEAEAAMTQAERQRIVQEHIAFSRELRERDALVAGEALTGTAGAFHVRPDEQHPVTDGPFIETREQIGGFYLLRCAGRAEAESLARQVPRGPGLVVSVHPIAET